MQIVCTTFEHTDPDTFWIGVRRVQHESKAAHIPARRAQPAAPCARGHWMKRFDCK